MANYTTAMGDYQSLLGAYSKSFEISEKAHIYGAAGSFFVALILVGMYLYYEISGTADRWRRAVYGKASRSERRKKRLEQALPLYCESINEEPTQLLSVTEQVGQPSD